jgi:hypothetical protein
VNNIWILMAFWIGAALGFVVFALMQMAREGCDDGERAMRRMRAAASKIKSSSPAGRFAARAKSPSHVE